MGEIYIAENKLNGMIYVGKTTKNILIRKNDHKTKASRGVNNLRFHNAIRKYGFRNFKWRVLERCDDSLLDEREIYYIDLYKSNDKKFGYNMTAGGDNDPKCNLGRKFSKEHRANIGKATANRVITTEIRKNMSIAQKERYKKDKKLQETLKNCECIKVKVNRYSLNGEFIDEWPSLKEAAVGVNRHPSNINKVCRRHAKSSGGFIWRYEGDFVTEKDLIELNKKKKLTLEQRERISLGQRKQVSQYDLKGNFIKTWSGIDLAAEYTGVARSGIIRCCRGEYEKSGGFIWKYTEGL